MRRAALLGGLLALLVGCDDGETATPPAVDRGAVDAMVDEGEPDAAPPEDAAVDAALRGRLVADPETVEFGLVAVGGMGDGMLSLQNDGEGPVEITAFDGLAAPFSTGRALPLTVPAGASRTLVLAYQPGEEGDDEATVTVVSDAEGPPLQFTLRGRAGRPMGELATPVLDFGVVVPGMPGGQLLEVRNTSPGLPLTALEVRDIAPPFAVPQGQLPATAAPEDSIRLVVQFAPEADGDFEQMITLRTDGGEFAVRLVGRAVTPGELRLVGVEPGFGPVDSPVTVTVHGGPFAAEPTRITIGDVELQDLALVDDWRVRGTLPVSGEAVGTLDDTVDVRVELDGGGFGVLPAAFVRTPGLNAGRMLDAAAVAAGTIGPEGNPWRLTIDTLAAGTELTIEPGTVILGEAGALTIEGVLRCGADTGPVVFSAREGEAGAWSGLRFAANDVASELHRTTVEYAGLAGEPALVTAQSTTLDGLVVRHSGGDGVRVEGMGSLVLLGGQFTDLAGDALRLAEPTVSVFRVQRTFIRRARWPLVGLPGHFGRLPLGEANDWVDNAHDAIGLRGGVGTNLTLANQPAGLFYRLIEPITVGRGVIFGLSPGAAARCRRSRAPPQDLRPPSRGLAHDAGDVELGGD
ncbi:MAG: choice-of-anchor D domain-containing protein, partial [Myxococcales bacterium]|nr:choice-of-anchor D domain-containing protein [Myxococcales bacterium]